MAQQRASSAPVPRVAQVEHHVLLKILHRLEDEREDLLGTLLGSVLPDGTVHISNSFFFRQLVNARKVAIDVDYHTTMHKLIAKVHPKETVIGWFSTGRRLSKHTALIHEFFSRETNVPIHISIENCHVRDLESVKAYRARDLCGDIALDSTEEGYAILISPTLEKLEDKAVPERFQEIPIHVISIETQNWASILKNCFHPCSSSALTNTCPDVVENSKDKLWAVKQECTALGYEIEMATNQLKIEQNEVDKVEHEMNELKETLYEAVQLRREAHNKLLDEQGNIRVLCRCRPPKPPVIEDWEDEDTVVCGGETFKFDHVFKESDGQAEVFDKVSPYITHVIDGRNLCFLAYGPTGTGKTYTMEGSSTGDGLYHKACAKLFQEFEKAEGLIDYQLIMSVMEVYENAIHDLMAKDFPKITIQTNRKGHNQMTGLTEILVKNCDEALNVIKEGTKNRRSGSTTANARSSRSHCLVLFTLEQTNKLTGAITRSNFWLIDLAGSEKHVEAGGRTDGVQINESLLHLRNVISAKANGTFVSYRSSNFTRVLENSMGPGSKIIMLIHINRAESDHTKISNTLRFGVESREVQIPCGSPRFQHTTRRKMAETTARSRCVGGRGPRLVNAEGFGNVDIQQRKKTVAAAATTERIATATERIAASLQSCKFGVGATSPDLNKYRSVAGLGGQHDDHAASVEQESHHARSLCVPGRDEYRSVLGLCYQHDDQATFMEQESHHASSLCIPGSTQITVDAMMDDTTEPQSCMQYSDCELEKLLINWVKHGECEKIKESDIYACAPEEWTEQYYFVRLKPINNPKKGRVAYSRKFHGGVWKRSHLKTDMDCEKILKRQYILYRNGSKGQKPSKDSEYKMFEYVLADGPPDFVLCHIIHGASLPKGAPPKAFAPREALGVQENDIEDAIDKKRSLEKELSDLTNAVRHVQSIIQERTNEKHQLENRICEEKLLAEKYRQKLVQLQANTPNKRTVQQKPQIEKHTLPPTSNVGPSKRAK